MTEEQQKQIKDELKLCPALVDWLKSEIKTMDNIHNVQIYSKAQDQAVEMKAQIKASKKIHLIFDVIEGIKDMPEVENPTGNDYGVTV